MSKLYDFQELVEKTGLPERKVRYYLARVLNAPGGTRGRKTFYPRETLDRLKLTKRVLMGPYDSNRGEVKPSLGDFQHWLESQSAEDISNMAAQPYSIKPKTLLATSAPPETSIYQSAPSSPGKVVPIRNPTPADRQSSKTDRKSKWQSFQFGNDLVINTRKPLTTEQRQQLALAGQLLQSMLE